MAQYDYTKGQYYKKQYPAGTRVLLVHMNDDPRPIPDNTTGIVRIVDDIGQIHCRFDNGHSHTIVPGVDVFRRLKRTEDSDKRNSDLIREVRGVMTRLDPLT